MTCRLASSSDRHENKQHFYLPSNFVQIWITLIKSLLLNPLNNPYIKWMEVLFYFLDSNKINDWHGDNKILQLIPNSLHKLLRCLGLGACFSIFFFFNFWKIYKSWLFIFQEFIWFLPSFSEGKNEVKGFCPIFPHYERTLIRLHYCLIQTIFCEQFWRFIAYSNILL